MTTCSFDGCDRPVKSRKLCNTHYMQLYKTGELWPIGTKARPKASEHDCSFEGCERPQLTGGLCSSHDAQRRRTGQVWPIGTRRPRPPKPDRPLAPCSFDGCPHSRYYSSGLCKSHERQRRDTGETWALGTRRGHLRFRGESDAEKKRRTADFTRAWNYGMTIDDLRAFFEKHGNRCGICGRLGDPEARGGGLVIDHDGDCCHIQTPRERYESLKPTRQTCGKCNRGLLCVACNAGIGQLDHDPDLLRSAAEYLERWRSRD